MFSARAMAIAGVLSGCSATTVDQTDCSTNDPCRRAFGPGSVCEAGYCTEPEIPARCARTFPEDFVQNYDEHADRILLGTIFSYTDHNETLQSAELAVRQVNENGGLEGRRYALMHCDYTAMAGDNLDDEEATALITGFLGTSMNVPAIVGPRGSGRTAAAWESVRDEEVVIISPSATSVALTALDNTAPTNETPGFLWRTAPPDSLQSKVIAADMRARMVERVAVIFQTGPYGDGLTQLFITEFMSAGGVEVEQHPYEGGTDFGALVAQVGDSIAVGDTQEVLFVSSDGTDYSSFLVQTTASPALETAFVTTLGADLPAGGLFFTDTGFDISILENAVGQSSEVFLKIRGTRPAPATGQIFDAFAASFRGAYGTDANASGFTANSFDAMWLALYGTAWSSGTLGGTVSGLGVARGLRAVSGGTAIDILPGSWTTVVDLFSRAEGIDVRGASGSLNYDPSTEETVAPIELWHVISDAGEPLGFNFETISVQEPS